MSPSICFVIPAFNAETTIADAIQSVLRQSRSDVELLVIDDGSRDATFEVASSIGDSRCSIVRTKNRGVGAARNTGLRLARSENICFLDSDDAIDPAFAERMLEAQATNDVVFCGMQYCKPNLKPTSWHHLPTVSDWAVTTLCRFNQFAIGGLLFRSKFLRYIDIVHNGAFPENSLAEDWEFLLRCATSGAQIASVNASLYMYRLRKESRSVEWEPLWLAGAAIIHKWAGPAERAAQREWSLRMLARASISGRLTLSRSILASLGTLVAEDIPCLAGSVRWTLRRAHAARTTVFETVDSLDSALNMLTLLGVDHSLVSQLHRLCRVVDWADFALRIASNLGTKDVLVLYGYGRNGREASEALQSAGVNFAVMDDRPDAAPGFRCIGLEDLGPEHVILITPDDQRGIRARLNGLPVRIVGSDPSDFDAEDKAA